MADELTPKQREALEIQQLVAAYQAVFGVSPKDRSTAQNMVWADIEAKGYLKKPTFVALARFNGDPIGAVDTVRGTLAEGRRELALYIQANIEFVRPTK